MAAIAYLQPRSTREGTRRLLADVEQATVAGVELGDRRPFMCTLTSDLHRNYALLQDAIVELKALEAVGSRHNAESARLIKAGEEACADLLRRLGPLLASADHLNAVLAVRDAAASDAEAPRRESGRAISDDVRP